MPMPESQTVIRACVPVRFRMHADPPVVGVFQRVRDQVAEHLAHALGIGHDSHGLIRQVELDLQPALAGLMFQHVALLLQQITQCDGRRS